MYSPDITSQYFPLFKATPTPLSESIISLSPNPLTVFPGKTATTDVMLEVSGDTPSLVQFELAYDPSSITDIEIIPGDFFTNPTVLLNIVNPRTGRISYALEKNIEQTVFNQSGTIAKINFTPLSTKKVTTLTFLPKTTIRANGEKNTLKVGYGTRILINPLITVPQSTASAEIIQ